MIRGQRGVHITTISELKAKDAKPRELGEDLEHGLKVAKGAGRPVVAHISKSAKISSGSVGIARSVICGEGM